MLRVADVIVFFHVTVYHKDTRGIKALCRVDIFQDEAQTI
jgi:hypothetical protein